jgi:hypothetical protein
MRTCFAGLMLGIWILPAGAATLTKRATITGTRGDQGKCTVEVDVDGAADVEISGDMGRLRTLSGQTAEWRRLECTSPMPRNPANFNFRGIDGRGNVNLVRDPRQSRGAAVVRIEDPKGGREGYTFDLEWSGGSDYNGGFGSDRGRYRDNDGRYRDNDGRYRDGQGSIFDGVGPNSDTYPDDRYPDDRRNRGRYGTRGVDSNGRRAVDSRTAQICQDAVLGRIRNDGYEDVRFRSVNADDRPGRQDWIVGTATARRRGGSSSSFNFSCSVDLNNGGVRSVEVNRR